MSAKLSRLLSVVALLPFLLQFTAAKGVVCVVGGEKDTIFVDKVEVVGRGKSVSKLGLLFTVDSVAMKSSVGNSVGELLREATPVLVRDYGRGQRQSVSFRGASSTHTSLYWNSMKINSAVVGDVDFSLLPASSVDRVSVAPGVSAIAYGDGALGGVVDMSSRPDWSKPFRVGVTAGVGSFSSFDAVAAIRAGNKSFQSSTKFIYNYSLNDFEFINRDIIDPSRPDYRPTQHNVGADYKNIALTQDFFVRMPYSQLLSASVMLVDNWRNLPQLTTYEGPLNTNTTHSSDRSARGVLNYRRFGEHLTIEAMLGGTLEGNSFLQQNLRSDIYVPYIDSRSFGRTLQGGVTLGFNYFEKHSFTTQTSALVQSAQSSESVRETGFNSSRAEFSQNVSWQAQWSKQWSTSLMGRLGIVGGVFYGTGSASVAYMPIQPLEVFFRVGYNEHFASLQDMYYTPGGNPDLKQERGTTTELGLNYRDKRFRVGFNAYASLIDDWIVWLPTHAQYWTPTNLRQVLSVGAEFQASFNHSFSRDWSLEVSGVVNLTRTASVGKPTSSNDFAQWQQLPFVPLFSGAGRISGTWRNLMLSYRVEGESEKKSATSADKNSVAMISAYDIHSLSLEYSPWSFLSVRGECRNLYDARYYGVLRRPMPPRSFFLTVKVSF